MPTAYEAYLVFDQDSEGIVFIDKKLVKVGKNSKHFKHW